MAQRAPVVDDLVRKALGAGQPVRALINLNFRPAPDASGASSSGTALGDGPYRNAKRALLAESGPGLTLVRDYTHLPIILVTIADRNTLERVIDGGRALSVQSDSVKTVN